MKRLTNQGLISLMVALALLAPAQQQNSVPNRSNTNARTTPARKTTTAGTAPQRLAGIAVQVPLSLPGQSTTLLPDGSVLILGGNAISGFQFRASINGSVLSAGLQHVRAWHTATVVPDGTVHIFGGINATGLVSDAEIFNSGTRTFSIAPEINFTPRAYHTATLLTDGTLLIVGGVDKDGKTLDQIELWDFQNKRPKSISARLNQARRGHTATLQADGTVRIEGGVLDNGCACDDG